MFACRHYGKRWTKVQIQHTQGDPVLNFWIWRCLGSTQHLKNLYGAGYTLEMKLKSGDRTPTSTSGTATNDLKDFVVEMFPEATLQESFADRLVFSVPQQSVPSLANCFLQLEKGKYKSFIVFSVMWSHWLWSGIAVVSRAQQRDERSRR